MNPEHIGRAEFSKHYGITAVLHYSDFCDYVGQRIAEVTDPETKVSDIRIESSWKDVGGNRHGAIRAVGNRYDEEGELGAEVVWLIRTKRFRSSFWSRICKQTNSDYYSQARSAFYRRDYTEFRRLSTFIAEAYDSSKTFQKMLQIAERQTAQPREQDGGRNSAALDASP